MNPPIQQCRYSEYLTGGKIGEFEFDSQLGRIFISPTQCLYRLWVLDLYSKRITNKMQRFSIYLFL